MAVEEAYVDDDGVMLDPEEEYDDYEQPQEHHPRPPIGRRTGIQNHPSESQLLVKVKEAARLRDGPTSLLYHFQLADPKRKGRVDKKVIRLLLSRYCPGGGDLPTQDSGALECILKNCKLDEEDLVTYPGLEKAIQGAVRELERDKRILVEHEVPKPKTNSYVTIHTGASPTGYVAPIAPPRAAVAARAFGAVAAAVRLGLGARTVGGFGSTAANGTANGNGYAKQQQQRGPPAPKPVASFSSFVDSVDGGAMMNAQRGYEERDESLPETVIDYLKQKPLPLDVMPHAGAPRDIYWDDSSVLSSPEPCNTVEDVHRTQRNQLERIVSSRNELEARLMELQADYHRESVARKAAEERAVAALTELEVVVARRAEAQRGIGEREELHKLRLQVDLERVEINNMEQEAEECIRAARHAKDLLRSADDRTKGQQDLERASVLAKHRRREETFASEFRRLRIVLEVSDKESDMEVNHLRSAVDENTREVIAAYDEVEKRRREMESIKRALESMDEKLYVGSNTAATIRQEIEATQGELRRRIELEHQSRFFTSGVGAASALDLGRKPLHPLPEGPVPKLQQQLQQKQQQQQQHRQQQRAQSQSLSLSPNGPVQTYGLPMPVLEESSAQNGAQLQWPARPPGLQPPPVPQQGKAPKVTLPPVGASSGVHAQQPGPSWSLPGRKPLYAKLAPVVHVTRFGAAAFQHPPPLGVAGHQPQPPLQPGQKRALSGPSASHAGAAGKAGVLPRVRMAVNSS